MTDSVVIALLSQMEDELERLGTKVHDIVPLIQENREAVEESARAYLHYINESGSKKDSLNKADERAAAGLTSAAIALLDIEISSLAISVKAKAINSYWRDR